MTIVEYDANKFDAFQYQSADPQSFHSLRLPPQICSLLILRFFFSIFTSISFRTLLTDFTFSFPRELFLSSADLGMRGNFKGAASTGRGDITEEDMALIPLEGAGRVLPLNIIQSSPFRETQWMRPANLSRKGMVQLFSLLALLLLIILQYLEGQSDILRLWVYWQSQPIGWVQPSAGDMGWPQSLINYFINMLSSQPTHQDPLSNQQIAKSISTINQLMDKINQAVQKVAPTTQESLLTETDDSELIQSLRAKLTRHKINVHQLHIKNKLSTVPEESLNMSDQTSARMLTPRDLILEYSKQNRLQDSQPHIFRKECLREILEPSTLLKENLRDMQQPNLRKKIMGIRKASSLNGTYAQSSPVAQLSSLEKPQVTTHPFTTKSAKIQQISFAREIQANKSHSKGKKGLSLLSKKQLRSEETERLGSKGQIERLPSKGNTSRNIKAKTLTEVECANLEEPKKKKSITPFLVMKQSKQLKKPESNNARLRTCLSRTNIRDFYTSKRIKL